MSEKTYQTEPIDYTGCHPIIAKHLRLGWAIWCKKEDSGREVLVYCFSSNGFYFGRYRGSDNDCYTVINSNSTKVIPLEQQERYLKDQVSLMQALKENKWEYSPELKKFIHTEQGGSYSFSRWDLCGDKVDPYGILQNLPDYFFVYK